MDIRKIFQKLKKGNFWLIFVVPVLFLIIGTATLSDYGVNWDEPFHFMRGQAYLHFFLTGKKDYSSLPAYPKLSTADNLPPREKSMIYEDFVKGRYPKGFLKEWRSYYQEDAYDFNEIVKLENGHPPTSGIMSALTNYVFFQRAHLLGDIESYHLFEVLASFLIVLCIALVTFHYFGIFPSVVASFSLAAYPLFFSESHFNIKDPVEAAFYGLAIITFYFGIVKGRWKWIIISAISTAFAFGTKFNALFLAPTLGIWLFFYLFLLFIKKRTKIFKIKDAKKLIGVIVSLGIYPLLVVVIFYVLWPYLWPAPLENIMTIIDYYRQIGLGTPTELSRYLIDGWNTYPIVWIFYTTPLPILALSSIGFLTSFYLLFKKQNHFVFLVLVWFAIPILRVSLPRSSIYGGVRQVMEFLPPMAILAGIGAWAILFLARKISSPKFLFRHLVEIVILSTLLLVTYEMVRLHPNQNVYFNQLIGGLSGAKEKGIPYWGNSYGNVYLQGVKWLNANAESGARLGLPIAYPNNLAPLKLRTDIDLSNAHWSGPNRGGEYEIELDFDWAPTAWYSFAYYDTYLSPVYEAKVDGVSLLKVWKNDLAHTKPGFEKEEHYPISKIKKDAGVVLLDMGKNIFLTRVTIEHSTDTCTPHKGGYIAISEDGNSWIREPEPIDYPQVPPSAVGWDEDTFVFLFAAKKARYILIDTLMKDSCYLKNPKFDIRGLKVLP